MILLSWPGLAGIFIAVLLLTWGATALVLKLLKKHAIFDHPNDRSSHAVPVPRGGGLALVGIGALAWIWLALQGSDWKALLIIALALALAAVSWIDDLRTLPPATRLLGHLLAVLVGMSAMPETGLVLQGMAPYWLDRIVAALAWIWFVNLFNFMDGIDGIAGSETLAITLGLAGLALLFGLGVNNSVYAAILAGAACGFLVWNRPPAKIFLGDIGSIPLGFLLGWLLLFTAAQGQWAPALLLPLYYLADATLTLLRRAARGEKVWQAHRSHFYQQAARRHGHFWVIARLGLLNAALVLLALGATLRPDLTWPAVLLGTAATGFLLWCFADRPGVVA